MREYISIVSRFQDSRTLSLLFCLWVYGYFVVAALGNKHRPAGMLAAHSFGAVQSRGPAHSPLLQKELSSEQTLSLMTDLCVPSGLLISTEKEEEGFWALGPDLCHQPSHAIMKLMSGSLTPFLPKSLEKDGPGSLKKNMGILNTKQTGIVVTKTTPGDASLPVLAVAAPGPSGSDGDLAEMSAGMASGSSGPGIGSRRHVVVTSGFTDI